MQNCESRSLGVLLEGGGEEEEDMCNTLRKGVYAVALFPYYE
jgi:hypothetical protein